MNEGNAVPVRRRTPRRQTRARGFGDRIVQRPDPCPFWRPNSDHGAFCFSF